MIAGVNGAGKSTLYQTIESLKEIKRINTDEIVKSFGDWKNPNDVTKAGKIAVKTIKECFENRITFSQETTLCGNAILKNIDRAKELGYEIEVHFIGVDNVEIAKQRVADRVVAGGHGIPDEDIERRFIESFEHLKMIKEKCDLIVLYDNTEAFNRFAIYKNGNLYITNDKIPQWFEKYVR